MFNSTLAFQVRRQRQQKNIQSNMTGELLINNQDAWTTWGVNMGEGFLDALDAPLPLKEFPEDESRLENGIKVDTSNPKVSSREIVLGFTITGKSENDYRNKKAAFMSELQKGVFTVKVPALNNEAYKLVYTGRSISYGISKSRDFGHFTMKCTEPNPADRT